MAKYIHKEFKDTDYLEFIFKNGSVKRKEKIKFANHRELPFAYKGIPLLIEVYEEHKRHGHDVDITLTAKVIGYVDKYKDKQNDKGEFVSEYKPVLKSDRRELESVLKGYNKDIASVFF